MTDLWKKLNWKAQAPVLVLHAPVSLEPELEALRAGAELHTYARPGLRYGFVLAFTPQRADFERVAAEVLPAVAEGAVLWFAFPKQASKAYKSDLNRDKLAQAATPHGLEPNRNVAIDDDWSALRFKRIG